MRVPQLGEADKRAVDMLLDQLPNARQAAEAGFTAPAKGGTVAPELLDAARMTLSLLDHYEVGDPPADLLARTMAKVQQHPLQGAHEQPHSQLPPMLGRPDLLHG